MEVLPSKVLPVATPVWVAKSATSVKAQATGIICWQEVAGISPVPLVEAQDVALLAVARGV